MSSPLVAVAVTNAFLFGVYGSILDFQTGGKTDPTMEQIFVAGCGSGLVNSLVSCPTELAKIQLQNQIEAGPKSHLKGPWDCMKQIYSSAGIKGCFRGMSATIWRETPSYGVYFVSYELLCRAFSKDSATPSGFSLMMAGGLSGIFSWISSYPFDVAKTKIQAQDFNLPKEKLYKSTWDCFRKICKEEGISVLFRGLNATLIRAFPTNAAIFFVYSSTMKKLKPE